MFFSSDRRQRKAAEGTAPYTDLSFRMLKCVGRPIPPHPGPLPEEREKHRPTLEHCQDRRFADRLATILPLLGERAGVRGNGLRMVKLAPVQEMRVRCREGSRFLWNPRSAPGRFDRTRGRKCPPWNP